MVLQIVSNPDIRGLDLSKLVYPYASTGSTLRRNDPSRPVVFLTYMVLCCTPATAGGNTSK